MPALPGVDLAPDGYLVTDAGEDPEANRAAATLLNISQQFLVGKPLAIFIAESERHAFYTYLTQLHSSDDGLVRWKYACNRVKMYPLTLL